MWRVRGVLANGVFTAWSGGTSPLPPARTYKVMGLANDAAIPPTSPPDDANQALTDIVLDWEPIKGAKSYEIQISTDALFPANTIVDQQPIVYGTRYSPPKTLNNDQYFWRIRATDAAGFQPDWSSRPVWHFKRTWPDQPTLLYPQNNATNVQNPLYFQWTPVKHASSLRGADQQRRRVPHAGAVPAAVHDGAHDAGLRRRPRQLLAHRARHVQLAGHGQGRVLQRDAGHRRDRRPGRDVHLQAAAGHADRAAQRQHLYADTYDPNQSLGAPVLTWNPVAGADKYKVTISGTTTQSFTTAALSYAPRDLAPGTYSWDVQTVDALGAIGAGHATGQRTFTIKQPPMVEDLPDHPGQFDPDARARPTAGGRPAEPDQPGLGSSYRFPSLTWSPVSWVDHYEVYVARAGNTFTRVPGDFEWAAGDDTGTTHLNPGNYEWFVKAVRKDGTTLTGGTGTFTIMSLPDIPVESYKAALTGNALTGNAGTAVDTCNLKLPSNCQNLRATPVLGWDSPNDNVGHYVEVLSQGCRDHQPDRDQGHRQHDVPGPRRARGQPGGLGVLRGAPPVRRGRRVFLADTLHALVQQADPAVDPGLPLDGAQVQNDVTLTWDDYLDSQSAGADPNTIPGHARPGRGVVLQRADRVRPELRPERHHDQGRPDDVHLVRRHLPRGHHLVAGPGGRPERQHPGVERAALLPQEVAGAAAPAAR